MKTIILMLFYLLRLVFYCLINYKLKHTINFVIRFKNTYFKLIKKNTVKRSYNKQVRDKGTLKGHYKLLIQIFAKIP